MVRKTVKTADPAREKCIMLLTMAGGGLRQCLPWDESPSPIRLARFTTLFNGRTNAILLPYVNCYNGTRPSKTTTWPKYNYWKVDEKFQDIAKMLACLTQLQKKQLKHTLKLFTTLVLQ